ncbi:hypothetical protein [Bacillus halotolerans]|uniref:hypothetical protein n=1 Tax=Bacillus halotolerans TaxID=260554 RepID=UPI0033056873
MLKYKYDYDEVILDLEKEKILKNGYLICNSLGSDIFSDDEKFLLRKINESLLIIQIVFPLAGKALTIMTIRLANANQVNDIELYVITGFSYGVFFFLFPLSIYLFRKRIL